jgi:hypothetical protein
MEKLIERKECTTEPVKAQRWRVLWFMKDGKSFCARRLYQDEETARQESADIFFQALPNLYLGPEDHKLIGAPRGTYKGRDLSHFIPMPQPNTGE